MPKLRDKPNFTQTFLPDNRPPRAGEKFVFREATATLELIAETHKKTFYESELTEKLESHTTTNGGAIAQNDLTEHRNDWVETITQDYRDYTMHKLPPNSQEIVCLMT